MRLKTISFFRTLLGLSFLFLAIKACFYIADFENKVVEQLGINWIIAPFLSRSIIGLLGLVGAFLVININPRNITLKLFILLALVCNYDIVWSLITHDAITLFSYGSIVESQIIISLLINIALLGIALWVYQKKQSHDLCKKWIKLAITPLFIVPPYIILGVMPFEFQLKTLPLNQKPPFELIKDFTLTHEKTLVAFFDTGCSHCKKAAKKLAISQKTSSNSPKVFVSFLGSKAGVDYFFETTNTQFDYSYTFEHEDYLKVTDHYAFPNFLLIDKNKVTRFEAVDFNYRLLHHLSK